MTKVFYASNYHRHDELCDHCGTIEGPSECHSYSWGIWADDEKDWAYDWTGLTEQEAKDAARFCETSYDTLDEFDHEEVHAYIVNTRRLHGNAN